VFHSWDLSENEVNMRRYGLFAVVLIAVAAIGLQFLDVSKSSAQSGSRFERGSSSRSRGGGSRYQGGGGEYYQDRGPRQERQTFEQKLWDYLQSAHYKNWAPGPGQNGDFYEGESPHGAFLKIYMNRTAAGYPAEMPNGSVIIKENYGADSKTLMAITVMYRSKGYDAEHNDWYWVKYNPDGTVALTPPDKGSRPIAGRFASCIECHSSAQGDDFVFVNDQR
jgi:hypothetical protein